MSFFARFNPFGRKGGSSTSNLDLFRDVFGWQESDTGVAVTWTTALQCTTALACTRALAEGLAQLPFGLYRNDARRRIEVVDHPVSQLFATGPNDWQTAFEFFETLMVNAVLGSGGYALVMRSPDRARVLELLPIPASWVTEKRRSDWSVYYEVDMSPASDGQSTKIKVERADMLHVRGPSLDGWRAMQGIKLAREAIGLSIATEKSQARLHKNGIRTTGAWSVDGNLDAEQHKRLAAILAKYQGVDATGLPLILDRAAKWQQMQMTGVDAQHLETRRHQIEEVCRAMRVMPIMVGYSDKAATYASAEQMFLAHVVHSLSPWVCRVEQAIARDLLSEADRNRGLYPKFSLQGLLRGDAKTRADFYQKAVLSGWMTRNEVRAYEEMDALDGLDAPLTPSNMLGHNGGPPLADSSPADPTPADQPAAPPPA